MVGTAIFVHPPVNPNTGGSGWLGLVVLCAVAATLFAIWGLMSWMQWRHRDRELLHDLELHEPGEVPRAA
jgi:hypothetical protein